MCGILGILAARGRVAGIDDAALIRMRDRMAHRGPDGGGLWRRENVALAHRRLAVIDTSEAAAQPMVSADGRYAIVYNGELYNDADLREELERSGARFRTASDTETVMFALAKWGPAGLARLRGMYALGFYDTRERTLLLARDPLGVKPLYYRPGGGTGEALVFASEIPAILAHPEIAARPDLVGISGYLTTIRTVRGERTMFEGIRTLRPGQALLFDASGDEVMVRAVTTGRSPARRTGSDAAAVIRDSVERHLRSDVPICCLLSGGLDSSIVASVAMAKLGSLRTYCSGAPGPLGDDFHFAKLVAERLGTVHTEAPVSREMFRERWPEMVARMGAPLSTPNEVAINEVAALRGGGNIVALSGEGADELFAGYDVPMLDAARFEGLLARDEKRDAAWNLPEVKHPGEFQLYSNAWISPRAKPAVLREEIWRALEGDDAVREFYRAEFEVIAGEREDDSPLQAHLRFHQRINLAGLLQRLDTATMLASVEGRTPFADREVAEFAEGLAIEEKFGGEAWGGGARRIAEPGDRVETKRALRRAFAAALPPEVVERKKASFPLPFHEWIADQVQVLRTSEFAKALFTEAAIEALTASPGQAWTFAWPVVNVAMWGKGWWG